jgi:hypothetical protein
VIKTPVFASQLSQLPSQPRLETCVASSHSSIAKTAVDSDSESGAAKCPAPAHRIAQFVSPAARSRSFTHPPAEYAKLDAMTFRVLARIGFVNGSCMDVPFNVQANEESEVKRQVTPEYVMENVSDDWGVPIANVTVVKAEAVLRR